MAKIVRGRIHTRLGGRFAMDQIDDQTEAVQFRWITLGFLTSGLGLALLVADSSLEIGFILSFAGQLRKLLLHPVWRLGVGGGTTALTFAGSYMLWRRVPGQAWAFYSTLLLLMNVVHVGFWLADHHGEIGLPDQQFEHAWLRLQVSQIFNWTEFIAWIGLLRIFNGLDFGHEQGDVAQLVHLRTRPYPGFAWLGLCVSVGIALLLTDWRAWPLDRVAWLGPLESMMLATASTMMTLTASFQIMLYSIRSAILANFVFRLTRKNTNDEIQWFQDSWNDDPWGTGRE